MRKHGIILDFKRNQVRIGDKELPMLREDADKYLQIRRQAIGNLPCSWVGNTRESLTK
jgi:hypothetical protein